MTQELATQAANDLIGWFEDNYSGEISARTIIDASDTVEAVALEKNWTKVDSDTYRGEDHLALANSLGTEPIHGLNPAFIGAILANMGWRA